jgi:hypothetical protein
MPTATDDTLLPFSLPSIYKKKVTAAFDGGQISSDGGVLLLAGADRRLGLIDTLAAIIPDHRVPALVTHTMSDILRARVLANACGYPDADDLDDLSRDPAFKLACGRLPETGDDLHSQPTMSRWENAPDLHTLIRMARAMVDLWCNSHSKPPKGSPSISTTPPTPCMAINSCRYSTRITTSAAFCRSIFMTPTAAIPSVSLSHANVPKRRIA